MPGAIDPEVQHTPPYGATARRSSEGGRGHGDKVNDRGLGRMIDQERSPGQDGSCSGRGKYRGTFDCATAASLESSPWNAGACATQGGPLRLGR